MKLNSFLRYRNLPAVFLALCASYAAMPQGFADGNTAPRPRPHRISRRPSPPQNPQPRECMELCMQGLSFKRHVPAAERPAACTNFCNHRKEGQDAESESAPKGSGAE